MKDKFTAGILAIFTGGLGIHKFYLNKTAQGVLYLCFCWTGIPGILAFIDGIILFSMSNEDFNAKYNSDEGADGTRPTAPKASKKYSSDDKVKTLMEYKSLLDEGLITSEEFQRLKEKTFSEGELYD